ncbi:DNRLRE domain-containing protein [Exiguobacterium sp. R-17]|uniref:DNRLRE domain-containing protein n=1 Tax=Exiguobacterium sp. R-17 TaxID=3404054 RepID=UPI003CE757BF
MHKNFKKSLNAALALTLVFSILPTKNSGVGAENKKSTQKEVGTTAPNTLSDALLPASELSTEDTVVQPGTKPGTYNLTMFDDEIQVKNGQKKWEKVDPTLKRNADNDLTATATDLKVEFDSTIDSNSTLLEVGETKNDKVSYVFKGVETAEGIQPVQPALATVNGNEILHPNILPNVDLRHVVLNKEVKEDIILKQAVPGLESFVYEIKTPLEATLDKKGHIDFKDKKGDILYSMPVPMMSDGKQDSKSGLSSESYDIDYELESTKTGYQLKLTPDAKWLSSEDRVYPIYIDPSVAKDASLDTFVSSASPTSNYNKYWNSSLGEYVLRVGKYDSATGTNYAFVKMPALSDLKGAEISAASLKTYVKWNYYAGTKTGLWVDRVNANWSETGVTWDTKPSSTNITSTTVARDQWATFNVLSAIKTIADGSRTDYGFKFHTNGNGQTYWKQLTASENTKNRTNLNVTYSYPQMGALKTNAFPSGAGATTGYFEISWPAAKNASNYRLQLYNGKGWRTIYKGTDLSYSTKGKRFWPTPAQYKDKDSLTGGVAFRDGDGMELPMDPSPMYTASIGSTSTSKAYQFRIVADYPLGTSTPSTVVKPTLEGIIPDKPAPPTYSAFANEADSKGYFNLEWESVEGATSYDILLFNGNSYERFPAGDVTSWSSKGKRIFPTEAQAATITLGQTDAFRKSGDGRDFLTDPRSLYRKTGTSYVNSTNYYAKVVAKSSKGESAASPYTKIYFPVKNVNTKVSGYEDERNQDSGFLFSEWEKQPEAAGYLVYLFNGKDNQLIAHRSKDESTWTSRDQKIWPKENQGYNLRSNGDGMELPLNPGLTYEKAVSTQTNDSAYYLSVIPYRAINSAISSDDILNPDRYFGKSIIKEGSIRPTYLLDDDTNELGIQDYYPIERFNDFYVNVRNNNQIVTDEDMDINFSGYGILLKRFYNSLSNKVGLFGKGWSSFLDEKIDFDKTSSSNPNIINFHDESGTNHLFIKNNNGDFVPPTGIDLSLISKKKNNATIYGVKKPNDDIIWFDKDGYPEDLESAEGKILFVSYKGEDGNKKPVKISSKSMSKYSIDIHYRDEDSLIDKVSYGVNESTLSEALIFNYEYEDESLVKTIKNNKSSIEENEEYSYVDKSADDSSEVYNKELKLLKRTYAPNEQSTLKDNQIDETSFISRDLEDSDFQTEYLIKNSKSTDSARFLINKEEENNQLKKIITSLDTISSEKKDDSETSLKYYSNVGLLEEEREETSSGVLSTRYKWKDNRITSITYPDGETEIFSFEERPSIVGKESSDNIISKEGLSESLSNQYDQKTMNLLRSLDEFDLLTLYGYNEKNLEVGTILNNDSTLNAVEYDQNGNVVEESVRLVNGSNFVKNGSFNSLKFWSGGELSSEGLNGKSLKLSRNSVTQNIPVIGANAYNLSINVKTDSESSANAKITFMDKDSKIIPDVEYKIYEVGTDDEWYKGIEEFTAPENAVKLILKLEAKGKGEVLFDEVQLTSSLKGTSVSVSKFNYVENGDFQTLDFWTTKDTSLVNDGFSSNDSVELSKDGELSQDVTINQSKEEPIFITAASKNGDKNVNIAAKVKFSDGTEKVYSKQFDTINSNVDFWQRKIIQIDEPKKIEAISVKLSNSSSNKVLIDSVRISSGRVVQAYKYDSDNHVVETKALDGTLTSYEYDQFGNVIKQNQSGSVLNNVYDEFGRIKERQFPDSTRVIVEYDEAGNISSKQIRAANSGTTSEDFYPKYFYNKYGDLEKKAIFSDNYVYYDYNSNQELINQKFPNGNMIKNTYNKAGMIEKVEGLDAKTINNNSFSYKYINEDNVSEITSSLTNSKKNYEYAPSEQKNDLISGNISLLKDYFGNIQTWNYMTNENVQTSIINSYMINGEKVNFYYDKAKRNHEVKTDNLSWKFRHSENGKISQMTFPTRETGEMIKEFNDNGLVKSIAYRTANKIAIKESYTYNDHGLLLEKHSKDLLTKYKYDKNDQLVEEDTNGIKSIYEYDKSGNLTKNNGIKSTFNKDNQLVTRDSESMIYDENGNRIKDGLFNYSWSPFNTLLKLSKNGVAIAEYQYDEQSRRIQKKYQSNIIRYLYDGDSNRLLAETDENGKELRRYLYNADDVLLAIKINARWYNYQRDYKGNITALIDDLGNVVAQYQYNAWGVLTKEEVKDANLKEQPFLYSSYYFDRESKMYYLHNRYYNPSQAVFLSPDSYDSPEDFSISSVNRYSYVSNQPTMYIDPSGNKNDLPDAPVGGGGLGFRYIPRFKNGPAGELFVRNSVVGRGSSRAFETSKGKRIVDVYDDVTKIGHESKVGRVSKKSFVKKQVRKDAELVKNGTLKRAEWHFMLSDVTGKGGPTKNLLKYLKKYGIKVHRHDL